MPEHPVPASGDGGSPRCYTSPLPVDGSPPLPAIDLSAGIDDIEEAARLLRRGALVAFPTETVYGLGGDATSERAVAAIFAAKGRPRFNPLISHLAAPEQAAEFAELDGRAREFE